MANCVLLSECWRDGGPVPAEPPDTLKTDKDGYFIIYSPDRDLAFYAAPGYPFSPIGLQFAQENNGFVLCRASVVKVSDEGEFYALTCPKEHVRRNETPRVPCTQNGQVEEKPARPPRRGETPQ